MTDSVSILQLSDSVYDKLRFLVRIVLPGLSTLYFTLSSIWGLPSAEQVVGTLAAFAVFFGLILQASSKGYNANVGVMTYLEDAEGKLSYTLEVDGDPADLKNRKSVSFKVGPHPDN